MGSEVERKDEREITLGLELGTGAFLPGGKLVAGFKRSWQARSDRYLVAIAESANVDVDEIAEAVANGDDFSNVFVRGLNAVADHGNPLYTNVFAHFVSCALTDPAKVDTASFLVDKFSELRPPHVRLFCAICAAVEDVGGGAQNAWETEKRLTNSECFSAGPML